MHFGAGNTLTVSTNEVFDGAKGAPLPQDVLFKLCRLLVEGGLHRVADLIHGSGGCHLVGEHRIRAPSPHAKRHAELGGSPFRVLLHQVAGFVKCRRELHRINGVAWDP